MKLEYKRKNLEHLVQLIATVTERNFSLDCIAGSGYRIVENNSRDISPRLKAEDFYDWCHAYRQGFYDGFDKAYKEQRDKIQQLQNELQKYIDAI